MSTSMGLPISAGGRPPANASGSMGLPVGMSIGQMSGSYGGVAGTHPGVTSQNQINARAQTAFNVQPEVTVAYRTYKPLPQNARRKDFLFTIHPEYTMFGTQTDDRDINFKGPKRADGSGFVERKNERKFGRVPSGVIVTTASEYNSYFTGKALGSASAVTAAELPLYNVLHKDIRDYWFMRADLVANIIRPLGVFHNRATHDAHDAYSHIPNSNVSEIISVSKSNHCFMRDIWGTDLFPGDQLGFLYVVGSTGYDHVEIIPFVGFWPTMNAQEIQNLKHTQKYAYDAVIKATLVPDDKSLISAVTYVPIGKVWAAPMHSPFNPSGRSNLVGAGTTDKQSGGYATGEERNIAHVDSLKMHSIEVELTPYMGTTDF